MSRFSILAAVGLAASVTAAVAAPAPTDIIVVTATRTEIPLHEATVPVSVITREQIELSLANDLAELLRFETGIDIGRNGGPGQSASLFLRGTESNHTLVLIDGVRMNPGTIGGAAIQHIAPEVIERVEIVKGARSALFGTDAIGGVINIITRRAEDAYVEGSAGFGSDAMRTATLSAGQRGDNGEFGMTVGRQSTDGFAPRTDSDIERGYDNLSANVYATRRFGDSEVSLRHWQSEGTVEYLDFFLAPLDQDYRNSTSALELVNKVGDRGTSKLIVAAIRDDIAQNQGDDYVESDRLSADWQYSQAFEAHTLTGGLYAIDETAAAASFGDGFDEVTQVRAAFLQDQWKHGRHRTFAAVRLTDHDAFGRHATWNAEYALQASDTLTLRAGLGHAFRAPDATDRFGFGGNPDLAPELADEAQLGLGYDDGTHRFDLEFYANDIDDLIEFDLQTFALRNIAAARIRGAQIGYEFRGERIALRVEVSKQRADDALSGQRLLRRAEESATLSVVRKLGEHRVGLSLAAAGPREDFGGIEMPGYVVADLTARIALTGSLALHGRVENLLDSRYQTADGYRMQDRGFFVELRYRRD